MTIGELIAAKVRLYGGTPPLILSPQGWQVVTVSVTFAVTVNDVVSDGRDIHCVDWPAFVFDSSSDPGEQGIKNQYTH